MRVFQHSCTCTAFIQAHLRTYVCVQGLLVSVCAKYFKTTSTLGVGTIDSTRIICTLVHLGRTRETHHHSTESPPSFLTGLEMKKRERERERVQGRECSFTFCSWQSLCYNLAEIIEVLKLLPMSPSVFFPLCQYQTRCQFDEKQGFDAHW